MSKRNKKNKENFLKNVNIDHISPEVKNGILIVGFFTFFILSLLSYFNKAGLFGIYFLKTFSFLFGLWGYFLVPISLLLIVFSLFKSLHKNNYLSILIGTSFFILGFLGILQLLIKNNGGGIVGYFVALPLLKILGIYASFVVLISVIIVSMIIVFNLSLISIWNKIIGKDDEKSSKIKIIQGEKEELIDVNSSPHLLDKLLTGANNDKSKFKINLINSKKGDAALAERTNAGQVGAKNKGDDNKFIPLANSLENYQLPTTDILEGDKGSPLSGDIKASAGIIKRTLQNFNIEVEMAEVNVGPTVTQYTFRPAQGVKLSKISALQNDLSLALAAHPIRLETPIPGRSLVGVELPNKVVTKVRLKNLVELPDFIDSKTILSLVLGRDVAGNPVFAGLEKMPHLLIAGATGSGKTICLNALILSLLYRHSPNFLKFILIDPKRVEFPVYNGLPHLLSPVIVESSKTVNVLRWTVGEMERRFKVLSQAGARDIGAYHKLNLDEPLPYIVLVIDELADLMASNGRDVEAAIVRLAQMSRAVGIHLIVATQRPSTEVITGLIKANITSRIAFQVASQIDSRTVMDGGGAEKLLGNGDMLFLSGDASKPRRIQGTYISDKDIRKVVEFIKNQKDVEYNEEVVQEVEKQTNFLEDGNDMNDDLYDSAKDVVLGAKKASASLLQRRLKVGYARAARLMDILERKGVVGPSDGAKPRAVYGIEDRISDDDEVGDVY